MSELDQYRAQIDAIDGDLVRTFLKRMEVTGQVGAYKKAQGIPVLDTARERQVIADKTALAKSPEDKAAVAALYEAVMGISRRQQRRMVKEADSDGFGAIRAAIQKARLPLERPRVLYQGEPGAYAHQAAEEFFRRPCRKVDTWEEIFEALERGTADYGVVPIENSSTGSINQVYDLFAKYGHAIVGEHVVKVDHCLAAPQGARLEDIRQVYSHEQGLLQCADYLKEHPRMTGVPRLNTAEAAQFVARSGDKSHAAICSTLAAQTYGLEILAKHLNTNDSNYTRFVVASPVMELREGRDKISALFTVPHRTGSLHEILTLFAVNGLNLMKLESRPILGRSWEYRFFVDFTGDLRGEGMEGIVRELCQTAENFRVLGNYRAYGNE